MGSIVIWTFLLDIFIKLPTTYSYVRGIALTEDGSLGGGHSSLGGELHFERGKLQLRGGGNCSISFLVVLFQV